MCRVGGDPSTTVLCLSVTPDWSKPQHCSVIVTRMYMGCVGMRSPCLRSSPDYLALDLAFSRGLSRAHQHGPYTLQFQVLMHQQPKINQIPLSGRQ